VYVTAPSSSLTSREKMVFPILLLPETVRLPPVRFSVFHEDCGERLEQTLLLVRIVDVGDRLKGSKKMEGWF